MFIERRGKAYLKWLTDAITDYRCRFLASHNNVHGFNRLYFYHVRKTGGTSVNHLFLSLSGRDSQEIYYRLGDVSPNHRIIVHGKVFVGWNRSLIEQGHYFYAFSHIPYHALDLPEETFTITCLRDPVQRVLSHYKMLLFYNLNGSFRSDYEKEAMWLGNSFEDFLNKMPREHMLRQLYMFSEVFDVDEAFENIIQLSHYFFTENFSQGITDLARKTGLALKPLHIRQSSIQFQPKESDLIRLRSMVEPEFDLYRRLQQAYESVDGEEHE